MNNDNMDVEQDDDNKDASSQVNDDDNNMAHDADVEEVNMDTLGYDNTVLVDEEGAPMVDDDVQVPYPSLE